MLISTTKHRRSFVSWRAPASLVSPTTAVEPRNHLSICGASLHNSPAACQNPTRPRSGLNGKSRLVCLVLTLGATISVQAQQAPGTPSPAQPTPLQQIAALNWQKASQVVSIDSVATFSVPRNYGILTPPDSTRFMSILHNFSNDNEYILMPANGRWFANFTYEATGYIKDNQHLEPHTLLASAIKGTRAENKERETQGWAPISIVGWAFKPRYSKVTHRLEWAFLARNDRTNANIINYNTRILSRGGVTSVVLVTNPSHLQTSISQLNAALSNFSYVPSQRYSEFRKGDRIAGYGLAALIVGGATAVAANKGLFAWLAAAVAGGGKIALAAVAGFFAAVRRFFKKLLPSKKPR